MSASKFEDSSPRSTAEQTTPRRGARSQAKHKDGEEEFFNMTYLSNLLPHPQCRTLIEIQTTHSYKYQEELYRKVKDLSKPFYEWNEWIKEQLELALSQYKEKKHKRLFDIGKSQAAKLFKKVDESKKKEKRDTK